MSVSVLIENSIAFATIDNPPVNAIRQTVRAGLMAALAETEANPQVKAVVLICAGRTFIAGADVREFGKPPVTPHLPDVIAAIETATKPWIAAIHGSALGGGLEIALGCHYRIADVAAKLGLPEVTLGLIPGAGGTVRLPRLISAEAALDMVTSGKPVSAAQALKTGLIDRVADQDLRAAATAFANDIIEQPLPAALTQRAPQQPTDQAAFDLKVATVQKKARGQHSPVAACEAIETSLNSDAETALTSERATFLALKDDPQSKALRHIFFAERAAGRLPALKEVPSRACTQIGVIGGGTMGAGIAAACILSGLTVTMIERDEAAITLGTSRVLDILNGSLKRGLISETRHNDLVQAFSGSTDYTALSHADLVIEAVFEDMDVKKQVFAELDRVTRPDAVLATNTSYLDVTQIAQSTQTPSRVIGLHFFSPAHIMKLLELVVPGDAAPDVIATGLTLGRKLRKITVLAGVCDGFIGNRIMSAYRREADYMIEDGALPWDVDAAMRDFGFPMGIYQMQDLAGLDIAWAMRKRQAASRDPAQRYVGIADTLCEAGRFGRKTGKGWYRYDNKFGTPCPEVEAIILASSKESGITRHPIDAKTIMERLLSAMQAEGTRILDEGIAQNAADIDVVLVNGYSFPRWRGGPMYTLHLDAE